jgi:glutamate-1-semialdehyde aminotransferase
MKGGIPEKPYEDVFEFRYNRLDQLEELIAKHGDETAAIIMTPFGLEGCLQVRLHRRGDNTLFQSESPWIL